MQLPAAVRDRAHSSKGSLTLEGMTVVQMKEAAEFREVKLKGKNHILKTGHYRLKNELKSDHKKVEQLQEQVSFAPPHAVMCEACCLPLFRLCFQPKSHEHGPCNDR